MCKIRVNHSSFDESLVVPCSKWVADWRSGSGESSPDSWTALSTGQKILALSELAKVGGDGDVSLISVVKF